MRADEGAKALAWVSTLERTVCALLHGFDNHLADAVEQVLLAGNVIVKRSLVDVQPGRDLACGRHAESLFAEQIGRCIQNQVSRRRGCSRLPRSSSGAGCP